MLTEGASRHGYFVRPTVLAGLPRDHELVRDELFVPIVAVQTVDSLDEALARANDTQVRPDRRAVLAQAGGD